MEPQFFEKLAFEVWRVASDYLLFAGSAFFLFYVVLKKPLWYRKVQQKMPSYRDYIRDVVYSTLFMFVSGVFIVLTFYVGKDHNNVYMDINEHSTAYYVFTLFWMFVLHDTWFYFVHRVMHHPVLFKHVHLIHHRSTNPTPLTAYAFHPLEAFLEAIIVVLFAFTVPVHVSAIIFYGLFQIVYNAYGHSGFEILPKGFHKSWFGKWVNTSTAHNLHHHKFNGNYGLYTLFWDRVFGTVREDYDETYERVTTRPKKTESESKYVQVVK